MNLASLVSWPWARPKVNGHAALYVPQEVPVVAPPAPAPVATSEGKAESDIAKVLSPSQVATFLECSAKWWYKHQMKLPETRSSALVIGSAFHGAVMGNFSQKVDTKQDLPIEVVTQGFSELLTRELDTTTTLTEKESVEDLQDLGTGLVTAYMEQVAPTIQPAHVEQEVAGEIAGVQVRGRLDVIDVEGRIIDAKTASKKPSGIAPNYRFQVATYATLHPEAKGTVRLDTVTKTKTIQVVQQSFSIGDKDLVQIERIYPLAQEAMRSGYYVPNRNSNLCSRKHCPFWEQCEEDYGGEVEES